MKRLSDKTLIERAVRYQALGDQIKVLEAEKDGHRDAVVAELDARGIKVFEKDGLKVTKATKPQYSFEAFAARLSSAVLRRITRKVVDAKALAEERKAGRISDEDVEACSTPSAPWIRVSGPKEQKAA